MRRRAIGPIVLGMAILAACSSSGKGAATSSSTGSSPSSSSSSSSSVSSSSAPDTTSTSEAPPTSDTTPPPTSLPAQCQTSELTGSLGQVGNAAGNVYYPVQLHNAGTRTCTIAGYPDLFVIDQGGGKIGGGSTHEPGTVTTISLAPGDGAYSLLHTQNEGFSDTPCRPTSAGLLVVPPDNVDSFLITGQVRICGEMFLANPFVAGEFQGG